MAEPTNVATAIPATGSQHIDGVRRRPQAATNGPPSETATQQRTAKPTSRVGEPQPHPQVKPPPQAKPPKQIETSIFTIPLLILLVILSSLVCQSSLGLAFPASKIKYWFDGLLPDLGNIEAWLQDVEAGWFDWFAPEPPARDYYQDLQLPQGEEATETEIKKQFRALSKKYHPDHNRDDAAARERYTQISKAYEVLSDRRKRKVYDMMGMEGLHTLEKKVVPRPPMLYPVSLLSPPPPLPSLLRFPNPSVCLLQGQEMDAFQMYFGQQGGIQKTASTLPLPYP